MIKAFNTINLKMLQKVLERIKVFNKATKFIINLFQNRTLKTITNYKFIKEIIAGDSLDQKETILFLL